MRMQKNCNPCKLLVEIYHGTAAMENSMGSIKKLKLELAHDPAIPLLSIYPKEFKSGS